MLLETTGSRGIVVIENNENAASYLQQGFRGVVFRNVTGTALVECVRRVAGGDIWQPTQTAQPESPEEDLVGARVRDRLTPRKCASWPDVQGCKNREIAQRLKTTEQVIKNYLRSIYDKPAWATGWNWPCSPFITGCWQGPQQKPATRWKPRRGTRRGRGLRRLRA